MTIEMGNSLEETVRAYAVRSGESEEEFVRAAVVDRITRARRLEGAELLARIKEITAPIVAAVGPGPRLSDDEAIGYNEDGLFD